MWLTNLRIWDGVADALSNFDAIEIVGDNIIQLANSEQQNFSSLPPSEIKDMLGKFVTPGLIDAHVHLCLDPEVKDPLAHGKLGSDEILAQMKQRTEKMLRAGITCARDLGGGKWLELKIRDQINNGDYQGTRLICSGQPITSVNGHCYFWGGEASDLESAKEVMARQIRRGVDLIKVMATGGALTAGSSPAEAQFDADVLSEIVRIANEQSFHVAAHCHGTAGIKNATTAGVSTIEHCSWVGEQGWGKDYEADVVAEMVTKGIWVSPTINAGWRRYIGSKNFEAMVQENYRLMRSAGIKLIASTDAGIPNVFHHDLPRAIPVFAHFAGLSNVEALRTATSDCAEAIGLGEQVGRIGAGYAADLNFYNENPLVDLAFLDQPAAVMSRGQFVVE